MAENESIGGVSIGIAGDFSHLAGDFEEAQKLAANYGAKIAQAFELSAAALPLAGLAAFIGLAVEAGETFEAAAIKIQRATGATGEALHGLEENFKSLYIQSAASGEAIADALTTVYQKTGQTGEALENLTLSSMKFAKVAQTDVKQSVEENQKVFAAWGVTVDQQKGKLDILYVVMEQTGISASDLSGALSSMGPVMRTLGFTFDESAALIGKFHKAGLDAESITMALGKAFKYFQERGIDAKEGLLDLIGRLQDGTGGQKALNEAVEIFGARSAAKLIDAARSGAFNVGELEKKLKDATGEVDRQAAKTETLGEAWTKMGHSIGALVEGPGVVILHFLTEVTSSLTEMINLLQTGKAGWGDLAKGFLGAFGNMDPTAAALAFGSAFGGSMAGKPGTSKAPFPPPVSGTGTIQGELVKPKPTGELLPATDFRPIKDASLDLDILLRQEASAQQLLDKFVGDVAKAGGFAGYYDKLEEDFEKIGTDLGPMVDGTKEFAAATAGAQDLMDQFTKNAIDGMAGMLAADPYGMLADGAKALGIATQQSFDDQVQAAKDAFDLMEQSGVASDRELELAALKLSQTEIDAAFAAGDLSTQAYREYTQQVQGMIGELEGKVTSSAHRQVSAIQQINQAIERDLSKAISDVIFQTGKIGDAFVKLGKDVVSIILDHIIAEGLKPLLSALDGVISKVIGVFGGAAGGTNAAPPPASAAGTAVSSITGIVGAAAGVVSAISGVIGNFQMAKQETTLNAIEHNTRFSMMYLGERADGGIVMATLLSAERLGYAVADLDDIKTSMWSLLSVLQNANSQVQVPTGLSTDTGPDFPALPSGYQAGKGGIGVQHVNIRIDGNRTPGETARAVADHLRTVSPKFSALSS